MCKTCCVRRGSVSLAQRVGGGEGHSRKSAVPKKVFSRVRV